MLATNVETLTLVVSSLTAFIAGLAAAMAARGYNAAEKAADAAQRSATAAELSATSSARAATSSEEAVIESRRAAAAAEGKLDLDTRAAVDKARNDLATAQEAANDLTAISTDSDLGNMRFGRPSTGTYACVLSHNTSDVDFHDLTLTFASHPAAPIPRHLLKGHEKWLAYPAGDKRPAGTDLGPWTLTYLDGLGRRWIRTSSDQHGPAILDGN